MGEQRKRGLGVKGGVTRAEGSSSRIPGGAGGGRAGGSHRGAPCTPAPSHTLAHSSPATHPGARGLWFPSGPSSLSGSPG